jgi:hypothetical protein
VDALAPRLRPEVLAEMRVSTLPPYELLRQSLASSKAAWTVLSGGEVAAMFGVAYRSLVSDAGVPWLLSSALVDRIWLSFVRHSRAFARYMLSLFPGGLENYVDAGYGRCIAWLRWCGFTLDAAPVPMGRMGAPFYRFWMRRD